MRKGNKWIRILAIAVLALALVTPFIIHIIAADNDNVSGRTADIFMINGSSYSTFDSAVEALNELPFNGTYDYVEMIIGSSVQGEEDVVVDVSKTYQLFNSVKFRSLDTSSKLVFRRATGFKGVLFQLNEVNLPTSGQSEMITGFWMPNRSWEGCRVDDPSARVLSNYGDSGK